MAVLAKLPPGDAALVPALAESLLLQHADALKADATAAAVRAAVAGCLHWSRDVRRAGRAALTRCVTSAPSSTGESSQYKHTLGCRSHTSRLHASACLLILACTLMILTCCAALCCEQGFLSMHFSTS